MKRFCYILARLFSDLASLFSRGVNAFLFGGSTAQTLSSRAYVEAPYNRFWARKKVFINFVFFWEDDHCRNSWFLEVERAHRTLEMNRGFDT